MGVGVERGRKGGVVTRERGERAFGKEVKEKELLASAQDLARVHGLNRALFEDEEMMAIPVPSELTRSGETQVVHPDPAAHVFDGLRQMLATITG